VVVVSGKQDDKKYNKTAVGMNMINRVFTDFNLVMKIEIH